VINERIKAEEERRRLQMDLAQAQKMESVGRLAGGVAHDFNNLLTVINGYSSLALARLGPGDRLREDLEEIRRSGERATALTRQLLAFSRKQVMKPRLLDLNDIVHEMEPMLRRLLGERVRIRTRFHEDSLVVFADQNQLEQVVLNLAVNARDAMPEGGELSIETTRVELNEPAADAPPEAKAGNYAVLAVSDTGTGMDEETKMRIFDPFFTTKRSGQGTGLGLATVHGIVAQSGGFISVLSEPGKGASFRVHLRAIEGAPRRSEAEAEPPARRGDETVIVVDDQEEVRKYTAAALKALGYRVLECGSATEAITICEQPSQRVDRVLTDMVMPGIGGKGLAARLAALRPGVPVLFMSGYAENDIEGQQSIESRFFLQKPFSPTELAEKVGTALGLPRHKSAH
jgi:nitrogen-specific signal transduction histidine kinase/CheY-like chemotaxis protein